MTEYVRERIEKIETPMITWALLGIFGCLLVSYAYFINATIANALAKTHLESEISSITSSLGEREARYLAQKKTISISYAHSLGFIEAPREVTTFVSLSRGFTLNR